jgi:HlyD family secretion protein
MKKLFITLFVLIILGGGGTAVYMYTRQVPDPEIMTSTISRGDVIQTVTATGTLEAVQTVQVGTQVTGIIKELHADFNSIVHKGQLLARIDRTTQESNLAQANANMIKMRADLERQRVALDDSKVKLKRNQDLFAKTLVTQQDLEAAQLAVKTNEASLKSSEASITQQEATIATAQTNLDYCDIYSPITGIVINRPVDVGQTMVSNQSASVIFSIAADLTNMQARASVDESDVAMIRQGQHATFRVDAYQNQEFTGSVSQVRLQPVISQNVVTYVTIVNVPNPELKLKPGMTTTVKIEIARRSNVLRVPQAALRFRPTQEIFDALKQEMPQELQRGKGGRGGVMAGGGFGGAQTGGQAGGVGGAQTGGQAAVGGRNAQGAQGSQTADKGTPAQAGRDSANRQAGMQPGQTGGRGQGGFGNMDPAERAKRMEERMKGMTPEQRQAFMDRFKNGGGRGQGAGGGQANSSGRQGRQQQAPADATLSSRLASADTNQTIDSLFGPLVFATQRQRAWLYGTDKKLKSVMLTTGITDGTFTEIVGQPEGAQAGTAVVTAVNLPQKASTVSTTGASPLTPQRGGGPGGGGGGGRGGGR